MKSNKNIAINEKQIPQRKHAVFYINMCSIHLWSSHNIVITGQNRVASRDVVDLGIGHGDGIEEFFEKTISGGYAKQEQEQEQEQA